ncbi:hypothetical protein [Ancylomarina sp. 16SWW S1-10-2]|uniref:hypothetical protein n=1 Tax=Ancylomarina sp. 16SWW S1-10-2 TaxID=2499681 RepID=UPI0012AD9704|nr:hypothetical protein [Ancylomarina sp. 16SWW S1-10-2]MRT94621.1 hypothetical protein [Ancylomarina sp. 16SWW S1-10-2]
MEVFINHTSVQIFKGARLKHAILKYSKESYKQLMNKQIEFEDEKGNLMDEDGQVWKGIKLFTKIKQND